MVNQLNQWRHGKRAMLTLRSIFGAMLLVFFVLGVMTVGAAPPVQEETLQLVDIPKTGMKSGQLTSKGDSSATISGQAYAFHPKIVFADDERAPREWKDFKKGDFVQYRLKQERIDFLVLELPK
jgi:hypothetical protein